MTPTSGVKRHCASSSNSTLDVRALGEEYFDNHDRDRVYQEIYGYLYANCNPHKANQLIIEYTGNTGLCTTKWLEETIAFKCYDCESDSTCAICVSCFFRSNHDGHKYRLTRTSGGCCDCGDNGSWDPSGSCSKHNSPLTMADECRLLDLFSPEFLARLRDTLRQICAAITAYMRNLDPVEESFFLLLLTLLDDLLKVTPAFRYAFYEVMLEEDLTVWVRKHQLLSSDVRKTLNSLYLTMVTSMAFKVLFSKVYVQHYGDIVEPYREPEEWHLSHLSVQLFTYSHIATREVNNGFLEVCVQCLLDHHLRDGRLDTLQFPRFDRRLFSFYLLVLSDFTYLMNHDVVVKQVLKTPSLYATLFKLLSCMQMMNTIQHAKDQHVPFENSGYVIAFTSEHTLHTALRPFSENCKSDLTAAIPFYKEVNKCMKDNLKMWEFKSLKLCRTFHIPFIRFFASIVNFNHIRQLHASSLAADVIRGDPLVNAFDDEVLLYVIRTTVSTLRFAQEVKTNLWVYNGESMHDQHDHYRQVILVQLDLVAVQAAVALLGLRRRAGITDVDPLLVLHKEAFRRNIICRNGSLVRMQCTPGDGVFRATFFMHLINVVLHDVKHLEKLSVPRNNKDPEYVRRGYPLVVMDVASALSMGRSEFGDITGMVDSYWRHHPQIADAVESLATVNYSQLTDKAYMRPKSESYRLVDVIWNPYSNASEISIPQEVLKRGTAGMLGPPRSSAFMQPEYYEAQDAILNSLGSKECFNVAWQFMEGLSNLSSHSRYKEMEVDGETTFHNASDDRECYFDVVGEPRQYYRSRINWWGPVGTKWNEAVLCALKTFCLLMETSQHINEENAPRLVEIIEAVSVRMGDDQIIHAALKHVAQKLRDTFKVHQKESSSVSHEDRAEAVKKLQMKFMARMVAQQKKVPLGGVAEKLDVPLEEGTSTLSSKGEARDKSIEEETCILCKQGMDEWRPMSFMCLISTNSVLRRCSQSATGPSVYARASLPLRSSMISCCGHLVHTQCMTEHQMREASGQLMPLYGIQRSTNEFFCPICKSLCNYMLEYIPESKKLRKGKLGKKTKLNTLCMATWRYAFCANWLPSPVHARFNINPHVMYTFNVVLPHNDVQAAPIQGRSFLEDLGVADTQSYEMCCTKCIEADVSVEYRKKCKTLSYRRKFKPPEFDRSGVIRQLEQWLSCRPSKRRQLGRLFDVDPDYTYPHAMTGEYCRGVFSGQRCLYGVQNWRHVDAGMLVDPKFWVLYHHILATSTCRRNQLTVKPSLLQHLVSNFYGVERQDYPVDECGVPCQLDDNFFDMAVEDLAVPFPLRSSMEPVTMTTTLVEALTDDQVRQLASALNFELVEEEPNLDNYNVESNGGKLNLNVTSPWSKDVFRYFLMFFTHRAPTLDQCLKHLANCVGMLSLQVLERFVLDDIKRSFATFVDVAAGVGGNGANVRGPGDSPDATMVDNTAAEAQSASKYGKLRFKRQFLTALYETYVKQHVESADMPANLIERVKWYGLNEHEADFRYYNYTGQLCMASDMGSSGDVASAAGLENADVAEDSSVKSDLMDVDQQAGDVSSHPTTAKGGDMVVDNAGRMHRIPYATVEQIGLDAHTDLALKLQSVHRRTVAMLTYPIPEQPDGEMGAQVRNYLHAVIANLLKVRTVHSLMDSGVDSTEFGLLLDVLRDDTNDCEVSPRGECDIADKLFAEGATRNATEDSPVEPERHYLGTDFLRRVNEEMYRAHSNFAFFEVLRHLVPAEYHLLDFVDVDAHKELTESSTLDDLVPIIRSIAQRVYAHVRERGYLHRDFEPDMDAFVTGLLMHLNRLLDMSFWTMFSVFDVDEDVKTKVSYAHLHPHEVRFGLLAEVIDINKHLQPVRQICEYMFQNNARRKLQYVRATGHESAAPLITGYDYIDMERNLPMGAWDLLRQTTFRACPTCGRTPPNPLVCVLCGSVVCHHSICCDRNKGVRVLRMLTSLERSHVAFRPTDLTHIYNDEVLTHANTCGGGQCVFISPFNCFLLYLDERRHCTSQTLYSDKFGNRDLHESVYGPVVLSRTRLANVVNSFCQGRLAHEIINIQKEASR
ncbi:zinc finger in N-recognin family protein, putative [Babesia bigemina]|uniref:E3 ubiquitin-protein ligase n=1 Tax=Babesia bigemina TaxID=5866 RepID=A0A061D2A0_BABBI|nr:zinc finger in N-recognin family protein, putative [Babesia bigemina]CDR94881.1 zinc finger in N-recognin family protein, putative [Babesia bigemina]|eukprot:XP_012767067.1 zinc finger in N-recognin family protein, putative [Babesia bigemina]